MKKTIIIIALITSILCLNKEESMTIPQESIRFRVIAKSNKESDQKLKKEIVNNLFQDIKNIEQAKTIEDSREVIKKELPNFEKIIQNTIKTNKKENKFQINYGYNYFPEKTYQGNTYSAGEYESVVITLGEGKGDNFWCVLFPPLCFTDNEPKEYKSWFKELIDKYF